MDRQVETTTSVRKFIGVGVIGPGCSLVALSRRDGRHRDAPHLVTLPVEARQLGEENVVLTVTLSEMRGKKPPRRPRQMSSAQRATVDRRSIWLRAVNEILRVTAARRPLFSVLHENNIACLPDWYVARRCRRFCPGGE